MKKVLKSLSLALAVIMVLSIAMLTFPTVITASETYTDVKPSRWSYDSIMYVSDNGLMNGKSEGKFAPAEVMTEQW